MDQLRDKVAVVTGGASGIGLATARALSAEGMKVVVAEIEETALDAAVGSLREGGHAALGVVCGVADGASVEALAGEAVDQFGGVHLVHLNAGRLAVHGRGPAHRLPRTAHPVAHVPPHLS